MNEPSDVPPLSRRWFLAGLAVPALAEDAAPAGGAVVVVLVRHAEKGDGDPKDPDLSEAGRARAALLARMLASASPSHVYTSAFKRTRATVAPLAERAAVGITEYAAADAAGLAARLRSLPAGSVAIVAGHSNTLPAIASSLGATLRHLAPDGFLRDDEYDRFVVVTIPSGPGSPSNPIPVSSHGAAALAVLDLRYGP